MASYIDELKTELTQCAICLGELRDPRCLPCLHSFCERCLKSSLHVFQQSSAVRNKSFQCPNCREKTRIPPDGIEGFPRDFKANKISEFLNNSKAFLNIPKCDFCKTNMRSVRIFCCNCRKHYCKTCEDSFHNIPAFDDHITLNIGLITSTNATKCDCNSNEMISHLCKTCNIQICILCVYKSHRDHELGDLEQEAVLQRNTSKGQLYDLQNIILDLQKNVNKLSSIGSHLMNGHGRCKEEIKTQSRKLQSIISQNERKHLDEADQFFAKTFSKLLNERDQQKELLLSSENLLLKSYNILLHGGQDNSVVDLLSFEKDFESIRHVYTEINEFHAGELEKQVNFIPSDTLTIGNISEYKITARRINERMVELDIAEETGSKIEDIFETLPDIIENDQVSTKSTKFTYNRNDKNAEKLTRHYVTDKALTGFESYLGRKRNISANNKTSQKIFETRKSVDEKHRFKETQSNKSEIKVGKAMVNQQETENTNNEMQCSYRTSNNENQTTSSTLSLHSLKTNNNKIPTGSTYSNKTPKLIEFQINKSNAKLITTLDQRGKGQGHLSKPFSVCFNTEGDIVVGELGNRRIQVFDCKGKFKQILAPGHMTPRCVVTMATDTYAVIDELTKSLKLINTDGDIETVPSKVSFPHDLCLSPDNTFIVTDSVFDSINKITMDGEIISQYSNHGNSLNDLDNPSSLYVTENNTVFVTDTGNHQVKFLDKDLNLMYKFGSYGNSDGQLRYPQGITGTKNFLLISDSGNNRIVMFTHSGKYKGCLLDKDSGILNPAGICFNGQESTLCIALPDCDQVRVYKVKLANQ